MRPSTKLLITLAPAIGLAAACTLASPGATPARGPEHSTGTATPARGPEHSTGMRYVWRASFNSTNVLSSVAVLGRKDAWAVGGRSGASFIFRWNGLRWRSRDLPFPGFQAQIVRASGPDNVWLFGSIGRRLSPEALRWDGKWHVVPMPGQMTSPQAVVLGPHDVSYIGLCGESYCLYHWNGLVWGAILTPYSIGLTDISATSNGNFWIAGMRFNGKQDELAAYRRVGTSWSSESLPQRGMPTNFTQVDAVSVNNVWLVANAHGSRKAWILHWNGRKWHTLTGAPEHPGPSYPIAPFGTSGIWAGPCLAWTGWKWLTPCTVSTIPGMDMATVPGTRSTWLVGYYYVSTTRAVGGIALYGPVP